MSPRAVGSAVRREAPLLHADQDVGSALRAILESELPALPVIGADERLRGIFGEREFISALFPGYLHQLGTAAFVPHTLDRVLEQRAACAGDPVSAYMTTEHVEVGGDFSDVHVAELFLHHRVLILPIVEGGRVTGVITRSAFFRAVAQRFAELT